MGHTEEEAAQISNDPAVIKEALENYSRLGFKAGETADGRRRTSVELAVAKEIGEEIIPTTAKAELKAEAEKVIVVELPPPKEGTVEAIQSIRVAALWNKSKRAYLTVDQSGNIMSVFETREQARQAQAQAASSSS
jgi:hypothetical protein